MDEKYINENLLVERYLQGSLSEEEAAAFEERFLSSPELLDELETSERLQQGMHDVEALAVATAPARPNNSVAAIIRSPRYAVAASFLLLVSLGISSFVLQQNLRMQDWVAVRNTSSEIVPLLTVRSSAGSEPVNTLVLGDAPRQFVLMLDPGFEAYSHYRAALYPVGSRPDSAALWEIDQLVPGYEEMLAFSVPSTVLAPGDYEVRLEGWRNESPSGHQFEEVSTIVFRCIVK